MRSSTLTLSLTLTPNRDIAVFNFWGNETDRKTKYTTQIGSAVAFFNRTDRARKVVANPSPSPNPNPNPNPNPSPNPNPNPNPNFNPNPNPNPNPYPNPNPN